MDPRRRQRRHDGRRPPPGRQGVHRQGRQGRARRAKQALEKELDKAAAKGLGELAKKLDSTKLAKLGTEAYEKEALRATEKTLEFAAKKSPTFLKKFGPKAVEGLGKVTIVLAIVFAVSDAAAAVDHVSKGGTIEFGPSLDTKELKGDTKINATGPGKDKNTDVPGDVSLTDTVIDIDTKGVPSVSGTANVTADKVTVRGAAGGSDGDRVVLNINAHLGNSTITIRRDGTMKGGNVVAGDVTIEDSQIEIDPPPGTVSPTRKPGETVTITGATIKVTQPGTGGGGTVTGTGTTGAGAPGTTGATGTGAPGTTGSTGTAAPGTTGSTGTAAPGTTGTTATTVPGATGAAPAPVATPDRAALERQVLADGPTRDLYKALLSKEGAVPTAEFLQRLLALEALIHRNGAKIAPLVAQAPGGGQGKDPIKDVIEPLEKLLLNEDVKLEQAMDKAIKSASGGPTGQTGQTGTTGQTGGQTGQAGATGTDGADGPIAGRPRPDSSAPVRAARAHRANPGAPDPRGRRAGEGAAADVRAPGRVDDRHGQRQDPLRHPADVDPGQYAADTERRRLGCPVPDFAPLWRHPQR